MNYAFHGAEHSRFSHSIGASYVASQMYDAVARNSELPLEELGGAREDTILATLLHDVGHGPFSHTLEEILRQLENGPKFDHEQMTIRIIRDSESEISNVLREYDSGLVDRLPPYIDKKRRKEKKWHHDIVSSQLDADRIDYLARDGMMSGVQHRFDYRRLIDSLAVHDDVLVVDYRAADVAESFLLALEEMYAVAYYHKAVRAAQFLLSSTIRRAIDLATSSREKRFKLFPKINGREDPLWLLSKNGTEVSLKVYQSLTEHHVWFLIGQWSNAKDRVLVDLATRLFERRLLKPVSLEGKNPIVVQKVHGFAVEEFVRKFPKLKDAHGYYVGLDAPDRVSYKRPTIGEGPSSSIRLLKDDGTLAAVDERERSIAQVISKRVYYSRLIVPEEIRDKVEEFLREQK